MGCLTVPSVTGTTLNVTREPDSAVAHKPKDVAALLGKPPYWLYFQPERLGIPQCRIGLHFRNEVSEVSEQVRQNAAGAIQ
jgi:hypothetical protein